MIPITGDHKGPHSTPRRSRPYGTMPLLRPPANDTADQHQQATIPDQGRQWINKHTNRRLRCPFPISKKHIQVGQAEGCDGDHARGLIIEVLVELAAWVDILK